MNPFLVVALVAAAFYTIDELLSGKTKEKERASVSERFHGRGALDSNHQQRVGVKQHNRSGGVEPEPQKEKEPEKEKEPTPPEPEPEPEKENVES